MTGGTSLYDERYGFNFDKLGLAPWQGPNDAAGEHFTQTAIERAVAREIIQNSLDAKADGAARVEVDFDLRYMKTAEIPGIGGLRTSIGLAAKQHTNEQGDDSLAMAQASANEESVPVLCVSDTGTTGLTGSESQSTPNSPLSRLTRSVGASGGDDGRGGSFGIGSAVGPLASGMRTVAYLSKPIDSSVNVLAVTSKLASFKDDDGVIRQASGFFTNLTDTGDFHYLRGVDRIGGFVPRTSNGTDVFIFDYLGAKSDPDLVAVKRATVANFWMAIHEGRLVVSGVSESSDGWKLDAASLEEVLHADEVLRESVLPFYQAVTTGVKIDAELKNVGSVRLYVTVDPVLGKIRGTETMRKPLMRIDNLTHRAVSIPYAAVFICDNDEGNEVLRRTEPPAHDKWTDVGKRANRPAVQEIKTFIREKLIELVPAKLGELTTIRGLERFLPINVTAGEDSSVDGSDGSPQSTGAGEEGPFVHPREDPSAPHRWTTNRAVAVPVVRTGRASADGGAPGETGGGSEGGGNRTPDPIQTKPQPVTDEAGVSRLLARNLGFRSFHPVGQEGTIIRLSSSIETSGDLELRAHGARSREEFELAIDSVVLVSNGVEVEIPHTGSTVHGVTVSPGSPTTLRVRFRDGQRFRLGVSNG